MWFIGVEVEQEKSAPPPKKNPGSAPELSLFEISTLMSESLLIVTVLPSLVSPYFKLDIQQDEIRQKTE